MLDLKKLEKELDEVLAKETPESLKKWLLNQRNKNYKNLLRQGYTKEYHPINKTFRLSSVVDAFSGSSNHFTKEMREMKTEMLDISVIPSSIDDKKALREDFNTFLEDTRQAQESLKVELENG